MQFGGTPLEALEKAFGEDEIAICAQIETEITRVLAGKFGWEMGHAMRSLRIYMHEVTCSRPRHTPRHMPRFKR